MSHPIMLTDLPPVSNALIPAGAFAAMPGPAAMEATVVQVMMGRCGELIPAGLLLPFRCLQTITQRHQFIDLGDDPVLLR